MAWERGGLTASLFMTVSELRPDRVRVKRLLGGLAATSHYFTRDTHVSGQIKEMFVDFNSIVKKGQVIARINPALFEAQVSQAKAQLDAAQAMVLNQQAVIEKTRADLESARAALASAHAQSIKSQVAVVDGKRNLGRQHDLRQRNLTAQADEDAAQVQY